MKSKFFEDLKQGLEEAIEYKKDKKTLRSKTVEIRSPSKPSTARIKKLNGKKV